MEPHNRLEVERLVHLGWNISRKRTLPGWPQNFHSGKQACFPCRFCEPHPSLEKREVGFPVIYTDTISNAWNNNTLSSTHTPFSKSIPGIAVFKIVLGEGRSTMAGPRQNRGEPTSQSTIKTLSVSTTGGTHLNHLYIVQKQCLWRNVWMRLQHAASPWVSSTIFGRYCQHKGPFTPSVNIAMMLATQFSWTKMGYNPILKRLHYGQWELCCKYQRSINGNWLWHSV